MPTASSARCWRRIGRRRRAEREPFLARLLGTGCDDKRWPRPLRGRTLTGPGVAGAFSPSKGEALARACLLEAPLGQARGTIRDDGLALPGSRRRAGQAGARANLRYPDARRAPALDGAAAGPASRAAESDRPARQAQIRDRGAVGPADGRRPRAPQFLRTGETRRPRLCQGPQYSPRQWTGDTPPARGLASGAAKARPSAAFGTVQRWDSKE
jgi:hypothetical protein